ncbi:MAG: flagellar hook-associated protein 3 [Candidatus Marinimicrobia bacterium]|nr:flagellar hook-associated protein 3 [Candidatus Neomarinimicrobiota bacterium]
MRVTQSVITRTLLQTLSHSKESLHKKQVMLSTGKAIEKPSSDPVNYSKAENFKRKIERNNSFLQNVEDALGWVDNTNSILDNIYSNVIRLKGIAIQGADKSLNDLERKTLSEQVEAIIDNVVSAANSTYLGKYVFAGTSTKGEKPFTYDGNQVIYNGNEGKIYRRVADNYSIVLNVTGSQFASTGIFETMINLRDALAADDQPTVASLIENIDEVGEKIMNLNAGVGSVRKQLELVKSRLEMANVNLSSYLSQAEDVDMAEAITSYNVEETAYKAALRVTANAIQLTLFSFLQ